MTDLFAENPVATGDGFDLSVGEAGIRPYQSQNRRNACISGNI